MAHVKKTFNYNPLEVKGENHRSRGRGRGRGREIVGKGKKERKIEIDRCRVIERERTGRKKES